jgi:hypothetical protein
LKLNHTLKKLKIFLIKLLANIGQAITEPQALVGVNKKHEKTNNHFNNSGINNRNLSFS